MDAVRCHQWKTGTAHRSIVRYLEGELPLEALNGGVEPGQSEAHDGTTTEQLRRMRRMAFLQRGADSDYTGATGFVSEATSEYGLCASSSSSDGDAAQSTSRAAGQHPGEAAENSVARAGRHSGELGAMSRRTRPGRAGLE